jgi:hypothetical protein
VSGSDGNQQPKVVESTGFALVQKDERIYPAEHSLARLKALGPTSVNYYFPVEIEVAGGSQQALAEQIFDAMRMHLEALV